MTAQASQPGALPSGNTPPQIPANVPAITGEPLPDEAPDAPVSPEEAAKINQLFDVIKGMAK